MANQKPSNASFAEAASRLLASKDIASTILGFEIPEARTIERGSIIHDLYVNGDVDAAVSEALEFDAEIRGRVMAFLNNSPKFYGKAIKSLHREGYDTDLIGKVKDGLAALEKALLDQPIKVVIAEHNRLSQLVDEAKTTQKERDEIRQRATRQKDADRFLQALTAAA